MWRIAAVLVCAVLLARFIWVISVDRMMECDVTQHAALPSPDGTRQAVVFDVDCGATTGFSTQVAISPSNVEFDREATPPVLVMDGRWSLPLRWSSNRMLHIGIPKGARAFRKLASAVDVTVVYEE